MAVKQDQAKSQTWGIGRRKSAVARVRLSAGSGKIEVNGRKAESYFLTDSQLACLDTPYSTTEMTGKFDTFVNVKGGGKSAQAEAILLGISRALISINEDLGEKLKAKGLLTRDPRMKERKKYGQHGARKGTQFSKR